MTESKQIDIKVLFEERIQSGQLSIEHIGTNSTVSDRFTMGLSPKRFHENISHIGVIALGDVQFLWEFMILDAFMI